MRSIVRGSQGASLGATERLQIILGILKRSRRALQLSPLRDDELVETAKATDEIIGAIPTHRLEDAYRETMRDRESKTAVQPQELLRAWRRLRSDENAISPPPPRDEPFAPAPQCRYCDDTGWQAIDIPERPNRYSVRPCICGRAAEHERKSEPLREPHWQKLNSGRWTPVKAD